MATKQERQPADKGKQPARTMQRVPPAIHGIQVNHCKNPVCENFGLPVAEGSTKGKYADNDYAIVEKEKRPPETPASMALNTTDVTKIDGRLAVGAVGVGVPCCLNFDYPCRRATLRRHRTSMRQEE